MPPDATLANLAERLGIDYDGPVTVIDDVHHDSRGVRPGSLFVAIPGATADGHDHAPAAVEGGAVALVVERPLDLAVPQIVVENARRALPIVAAEVHGHPSRDLTVIGVTGTNGKTTVTHMIESIAHSAGLTPGIVGTIGARIDGDPVRLARTTPEASDLQRLLAAMRDRHVDLAALEVSSHALSLGRVDGVVFTVAAFTNLSHDHLDFHGDMEQYYRAKARLFTPERSRVAVVWVEDEWGRRLLDDSTVPVVTVGMEPTCDVAGSDIRVDPRGSHFTLTMRGVERRIRMPLPGRFNVANALIAAACADRAGVPFDEIATGLETLPPVPGRLEPVTANASFAVIVDYAHAPDPIAAVIDDVRSLGARRVIAVVGAGGDRDRAKRPLMGKAAATADLAVITSDNPRSEDPLEIIEAVTAPVVDLDHVVVEPDRRLAIRFALESAEPGDVVLVLGKGHEQGQEFADHTEPFDDRLVAAEELVRTTEARR